MAQVTDTALVVQIGGLVAIALAALVAVLKGYSSTPAAKSQEAGGVQMFFDGPIAAILQEFKKIALAAERGAIAADRIVERFPDVDALRVEFAEMLRRDRHDIYNKMHIECTVEVEKLELRVREMESQVAVLRDRGNRAGESRRRPLPG